MTEDLEGKIKTTIQLQRDLREYKSDIIGGVALGVTLGLLTTYYRYHSDNPNFSPKSIPTIAAVFIASKAITYVLAAEKNDKDRMQKRLRELKGEIVTSITGLGLFYGSYLF